MNKEILILDNIGVDKLRFHYPKNPILRDDVDINKILISTEISLVKRVIFILWLIKITIIKLSYCV